MNKVFLVLLFGVSFNLLAKNTVSEKPFYGKEIKADKAIILDDVINNFSKFDNKDIVMEAQVEKVCVHKGCWMTLQGSSDTFRVKFHKYSYFVPLSLQGKKVWVEGEIKRKKLSVKEKKHYLEDAGASKEELAKITKPSFEYSIVAKGVKVLN